MNEEIRSFVLNILKDVNEIRDGDLSLKERIPLEIMALNAVANAYDKIDAVKF